MNIPRRSSGSCLSSTDMSVFNYSSIYFDCGGFIKLRIFKIVKIFLKEIKVSQSSE